MCLPSNWIKFLIRFTAEPQINTGQENWGAYALQEGKMKQARGKGWKRDSKSQNWCWKLNLMKPQPHSSSQEKVSSCWPALLFLTLQSFLWTLSGPGADCSPQSGKICPRIWPFHLNVLGPIFQGTEISLAGHTKPVCWGMCLFPPSRVRNPRNSDGEKCKRSNIALIRKSSSPTTCVDNKSSKSILFGRWIAKIGFQMHCNGKLLHW